MFEVLFLGKGREVWFLGLGRGRVEVGGPFTLIEGTDGVTEMDGALIVGMGADGSLMDIVGIGVTEMDGGFTLPRSAGLTEIDGVSWTEIVGMGGAGDGLERVGGVWETFIVGIDGAAVGGVLTFLENAALGSGLAGGSS